VSEGSRFGVLRRSKPKGIFTEGRKIKRANAGGASFMGLTHLTVALKSLGSSAGSYESDFLVDTGATHCVAPAAKLREIAVEPVGTTAYELSDGTTREYPFGLVEIRFMGEITAGRVVFGPDDVEPLLGVTALESVGITVDPANRTLKRLPAIPLKATAGMPL
jgi:clan AA aspartic protease